MKCSETLTINEELSNVVEAANYEVQSRLDVIAYMLSNNMSTSTDSFRSYQAELVECKKKYELAKAELEKQVVTPYLDSHSIERCNWNLDFASRTITIEWEGDGSKSCTCGTACYCVSKNEA